MLAHHTVRRIRFLAVAGLLAAIFLPVFTRAEAQTGQRARFYATVHDLKSKQALKGVRVEVYPAGDGAGFAIETDKRGEAVHVGVPEGRYRVMIVKDGYASVEVTDVETINSRPVRLNVEMLKADLAPYKVKRIKYEPSLIETEDAGIRIVIRG